MFTPTRARAALTTLATGILLAASACTATPTSAPTVASSTALSSPTGTAETSSAPEQTAPDHAPEPVTSSPETPAEEPSPTEPEPTASASPTYPVNDGYVVDAAAITTHELTTGTPVEDVNAFTFAAADQPSVVFQSPDNSVACLLQPYGAFCMTDDSVNWVLLSVSMKPGATQPRSLQAQGRAATHEWFATGTPLPEGQSVSWMGMTCTSVSPSAIHCHDGVTGFTLSDAEGR